MKMYVVVEGEKYYIEEEIMSKYGLKKGEYTPFTGLEMRRD